MDIFALISEFELQITNIFGWPLWISRTIIILCSAISIVGIFQLDQLRQLNNALSNSAIAHEVTWKFRKFQLSYLIVYLIIMLADWLQGTNMYTLYSVRDEDIYMLCILICTIYLLYLLYQL